jgi:uncharacterized membrane protein
MKMGRKAAEAAKREREAKTRGLVVGGIVGGVLVIAICVAVVIAVSSAPVVASVVQDSDVVIPIKNVTAQASIYPVQVNGEQLEVFAVKASDGSIKTAFNTCIVCYPLGNGYYSQDGTNLICQQCGTVFAIDSIGTVSGECNPIPIPDESKTVDSQYITVPYPFLQETKATLDTLKTS